MKKQADIVIIGAGIMGSSLAYFLAKRGKEVVVVEKNEICSGTSSSTAAWLWPSDKRPECYGKLCKDAYDIYMGLEEELGESFEMRICGSLDPAKTDEDLENLKDQCDYDNMLGYKARMLSPEEVKKEEPLFEDGVKGALLVETDGHINPFLLVNAYIQAAKKLGAEVNTFTEVEGFNMTGDHIDEVVTNKGNIKANLVICAAGIYSRKIGDMLGLDAHVFPERGFTLVSEKLPKVLNHVVLGARQTVAGNVVFGFVADKVDKDCLDRNMYIRGLNWAAKEACSSLPGLQNVNIIRSYTGIRCKPDDKLPILGPTEKIDNFWFHLMHSAFAGNPGASDKVAQVICGEAGLEIIDDFRYTRFND